MLKKKLNKKELKDVKGGMFYGTRRRDNQGSKVELSSEGVEEAPQKNLIELLAEFIGMKKKF